MMNLFTALALLVGALQLLDLYTTIRIIRAGGYEKTPLVIRLMERFGMVGGILVAKAISGALIYALWRYSDVWPEATLIGLVAMLVFTAKTVLGNFKVIRRQ